MEYHPDATSPRHRAKQDKQRHILTAASDLLAEREIHRVSTQKVADRADIGTLYLYAGTKAELLIMVQNQKLATTIDDGLAAAAAAEQHRTGTVETILEPIRPVIVCTREQPENRRIHLHELVSGEPLKLTAPKVPVDAARRVVRLDEQSALGATRRAAIGDALAADRAERRGGWLRAGPGRVTSAGPHLAPVVLARTAGIPDIRYLIGVASALVRRGFEGSGPVVELVLDDGLELGRAG